MAKNYVKFPLKFFETKEWSKPREYTKAEAILFLINNRNCISIRHLARSWQWSKTSVERFIKELKQLGMWDTFWDTFWDTKHAENKQVAESFGTQSGTPFGTHLIEDNIIPPKILSTTNVVSNISSPPKGESESVDDIEFQEFQRWVMENAPRVAKMKEPFTKGQFISLKTDFDAQFYCALLTEMHNYEPLLRKNRSANLTFRNWARRRKQWDNEKSTTKKPNDSKSRIERAIQAAARGYARANTPQEWKS